MDLEKLVEDIKQASSYTSNLKNENDYLQNKINSLENHISTLESLLKDKENSFNDLLDRRSLDETNVLDKIISLQVDHKLKQDSKQLAVDYADLQDFHDKSVALHAVRLDEVEKIAGEKITEANRECDEAVAQVKKEQELKVQEMEGEVAALKNNVQEVQRLRVEETTKVCLSHCKR